MRNYFCCPNCQWRIAWGFMPSADFVPPESNPSHKGDPDMGLMIGTHIETAHPELLYGSLIPAYLAQRLMGMLQSASAR